MESWVYRKRQFKKSDEKMAKLVKMFMILQMEQPLVKPKQEKNSLKQKKKKNNVHQKYQREEQEWRLKRKP